jgi:hypothetical protein
MSNFSAQGQYENLKTLREPDDNNESCIFSTKFHLKPLSDKNISINEMKNTNIMF